jgi:nucleolar protein 12
MALQGATTQFLSSMKTLIHMDQDINAVETALLYNDKKFPPMLPRKLRVTRAKHMNKTASASNSTKLLVSTANPARSDNKIYNPKPNSQMQSLHGRASKLLGRAGAAKLRASAHDATKVKRGGPIAAMKTPETVVFEGYRAKSGARLPGMRISGGSGKKKGGKERSRRTARAAAWKTSGRKK